MNKTTITVRAGRRRAPLSGGLDPYTDVTVETNATTGEQVERLIAAGELCARGLTEALGVEPFAPVTVDVAAPALPETPAAEDTEDAPTPEAEWLTKRQATYQRMHDAITTAVENIGDVATELQDAQPTEERARVLGVALEATVKELREARG